MTVRKNLQSIYDALPVEDKVLHWIEDTDRRFDGCSYLGEHPEVPDRLVQQQPQLTLRCEHSG
jgi:uncharacterized protein